MVESSPSTIKRLREIFELLLRTMKTLSLYEARNPVSENLETELHNRLTTLLEEEGPLPFKVLQYQILLEDEVVYENRERKESLAFLLSRDGIHGLLFRPGLQSEELRAFVSCLNRARVLVGGEDDLATLLWDQDFEAIDYFVVDELPDNSVGAELDEALVGAAWSGTSDETPAGGEAGDSVTLEDLRQSPRLPVEGAQLSDAEIETLHRELAEERAADLPRLTVELAVELVMFEPDPDERRTLGGVLAGALDQLVLSRPEAFLRSFEYLGELAGKVFTSEQAVTELYEQVRHALAAEQQLDRFLEAVDGEPELADRVAQFLERLPEIAFSTLMSRLGRLQLSSLRHAVSDAILQHGDRGPKELLDRLPALRAAGENLVIDELFRMVRRLPEESAYPLFERLLGSGDSEIERRSALILGHLRGERAEQLFLGLVETGEPEMKSLAISALARSADPALAPLLLRQALEPGYLKLDPEELRRQLAAIGRLGGDSVLPDFGELLHANSQWWFATGERKQLIRALVHGVGAVGSGASKACLEQLATSRNRMLRTICREELAEGKR